MAKALTVLIVEDDENWQDIIQRHLKEAFPKYNLNIYFAKSHFELEKQLQEGSYDLAFVDFALSDPSYWYIDAIRSARKLEEHTPGCIRIGVSAMASEFLKYPDLEELYHQIISTSDIEKEKIRSILKEYGI